MINQVVSKTCIVIIFLSLSYADQSNPSVGVVVGGVFGGIVGGVVGGGVVLLLIITLTTMVRCLE